MTGAGTTNFVWDGQDLLLETDVSNNTQVTYTQTPAVYGNLVSQRRSTTTKYYHFDALGSTVALTDANEDVTDTDKYFAFGKSLTNSGNTVNNLRFVGNLGYYNEAALSLQYLRARYYQPSTGRFVSVDPIRDGLNWYAYVSNSPVNMVDPSGLKKPPKPCGGDGDGDGSTCKKVYFWVGDMYWSARAWVVFWSGRAAKKLKKLGCETEVMGSGTTEDFDLITNDPSTVGFAVAAHGGCNKAGDTVYFIGTGGITRQAHKDPSQSGSLTIKPLALPDKSDFVFAYFGHCRDNDHPCPPVAEVMGWYASALGVDGSKVGGPTTNSPTFAKIGRQIFSLFPAYFKKGCF